MILSLYLSTALAFSLGALEASPSILSVEEAFPVDSMQHNEQTIVRFSVFSDEYYLYRDSFEVVGDNGKKPTYAYSTPGEAHYDEFFGETYIYRSEAILVVFSDEPFTVRYQGCKEKTICYPPSHVEING